jgi:LacI family transcriptional regulator, gluconate utilization system Gnt-I transcriptional repressor
LQPAGLQLLLGHTDYKMNLAETLIATMLERRPEAMIVTYDDHTARSRRLLKDSGIPIIEIWEIPRQPIGHVVGFSNRKAAAAMTAHLIDLGRKRIAFLGEANDKGTRGAQRRQGFSDALRAAGLDASRLVNFAQPPIGMLEGRAAMNEVLDRWPDLDAVMCVSDPCAYGALSACHLRGIEVPKQIAVAGFGDFEISRCSLPAISTISVSGRDIGTKAGTLVLNLLGQGASSVTGHIQQIISVDADPVVRPSTVVAGAVPAAP